LSDALNLVWRRAEIPNHVLSAAEIAPWQPDQLKAIIELGLLRRTSDATALTCEDCGQPHPVEIIRDPRKPQQPYYLCGEIGRVRLAPTDLWRWEVDFDQVAAQIRQVVGLTGKASTLVPSRIWLLGRQRTESRGWELILMRGLCWPDGLQLLDQCSRLQQSPASVIVVPYRLPLIEGSPARPWPIRTLSEIVSLEGMNLVIDFAALDSAIGAFGRVSADSGENLPRKRMSRSLGTPAAVKVVTEYLEHRSLTDTHFGNEFNSTDRTVRNFRKTGKMRRSTFEEMARCMGLTVEELLRGDWPSSTGRR
jgi:hypothetical protein